MFTGSVAIIFSEIIRHPFLAARLITRRVKEIPSKGLPKFRTDVADDSFDDRYGVDTSKIVQIPATKSRSFSRGNKYQACSEAAVRWCIENCGMSLHKTTFIDIGSGKGRALIVASMYAFRRVIGVEYSPELATICLKNLRTLRIEEKCELVIEDATDFKFPDEDLLVFFYNPFDSVLFRQVLANLARVQGQVRIGQLGPGHDVIQGSGIARRLCSGHGPALYEILATSQKPS